MTETPLNSQTNDHILKVVAACIESVVRCSARYDCSLVIHHSESVERGPGLWFMPTYEIGRVLITRPGRSTMFTS